MGGGEAPLMNLWDFQPMHLTTAITMVSLLICNHLSTVTHIHIPDLLHNCMHYIIIGLFQYIRYTPAENRNCVLGGLGLIPTSYTCNFTRET